MKNKISKKIVCLAVMAVMLLAGSSVKSALAYFTTYIVVRDTNDLQLGFTETQIEMVGESNQKTITVKNVKDAACYVRVKAIIPSEYGDVSASGTDWTAKDGYYEYTKVLNSGETTEKLVINIPAAENATEDYNVVAIQECTPVLYSDAGDTYADWSGEEFIIVKK